MTKANAGTGRSLFQAVLRGLACRCPRCGKGPLYKGFIDAAPSCSVCHLDFAFADSGDGPAVFVIMIVGFLVVGAALVVEVKTQPPLWLLAAILLPLTLGLCLAMLRPVKALLISLQYHYRAQQGRVEGP